MHGDIFRKVVSVSVEKMLKFVPQRVEIGSVVDLRRKLGPQVGEDGRL